MKLKQLSILLSVFIFSTAGFSQEEELSSVFSSKENSLFQLSNMNSKKQDNIPISLQNNVYVQQIGNNNNSNINLKSSNVDVSLNQLGNNNSVDLNKSGQEINQFILQNGNSNVVTDFNYKSNNTINSNYSQVGNNLNITSVGSNSISEQLIIKQRGNSGSVIILNK